MTIHTRISGTGHHFPDRVVTNEELAPLIGSTPDWISERVGIQSRHWAAEGDTTSGLAESATRLALDDAELDADDLDAIVFATLSPDMGFPGSGVLLQALLEIPGTPAIDVRNQCSGFLYGLSVARAWIASGTYKRVLVVGSEIHSTGLDLSPEGKVVSGLFGDGAGAVIVEAANEPGIIDLKLGADGRGAHALWSELPSSSLHPAFDAAYLAQGRQYPQMQGRAVFRKAVETLERELKAILNANNLKGTDVLYVPHQANKHICQMVADRVGIPLENMISTIETHGNTTAASIPCALDVAGKSGQIPAGTTVLTAAFGSGYTWGCALVKF